MAVHSDQLDLCVICGTMPRTFVFSSGSDFFSRFVKHQVKCRCGQASSEFSGYTSFSEAQSNWNIMQDNYRSGIKYPLLKMLGLRY